LFLTIPKITGNLRLDSFGGRRYSAHLINEFADVFMSRQILALLAEI